MFSVYFYFSFPSLLVVLFVFPPLPPCPKILSFLYIQLARTTGWNDWLGYCMAFRL